MELLQLIDSLPELTGYATVVRTDGSFNVSLDLSSNKTVEMEVSNVN